MQASTAKSPAAQWVALGVFTQPHGVSGRIKVKSFTEPADDFAKHENLTDEAGNPIKLKITGHTQGLTIVEIEGITKREQAELIRGKKIGVLREQMPEIKQENVYYSDDLIGMRVLTTDSAAFGTVTNVVNYGASDILEIKRPDGKMELYAFTHANFPEINQQSGLITIHPPEVIDDRQADKS